MIMISDILFFFRKHKDRADDIPNCPSIESIINMPMSDEISSVHLLFIILIFHFQFA